MGEALVGGLVGAGWKPADLGVVEPLASRRRELTERFDGLVTADEAIPARGAVIAVKPDVAAVAAGAAVEAGATRLLSIAAGVPLDAIEAVTGRCPVVRAMPNTPALIGAGAAAIAAGSHAGEEDLVWAEAVLGAVGTVVRVPEHLLDAVTGLSGSGPAYVFLVAEALIEAGVLVGLPRHTATQLATQTLLGSARLLAEGDEGPEALRAAVTSPGGTTAAGLRVLEAAGLRSALLEAVAAAADRSAALGRR